MAKSNEDEATILVVATASGFYGGIPREAGDKFRVPSKKSKASWFEPVDKPAAKPRKKAAENLGDWDGDGAAGGDAAASAEGEAAADLT